MRAETSISHGQPPNDGLLSERLTEHQAYADNDNARGRTNDDDAVTDK